MKFVLCTIILAGTLWLVSPKYQLTTFVDSTSGTVYLWKIDNQSGQMTYCAKRPEDIELFCIPVPQSSKIHDNKNASTIERLRQKYGNKIHEKTIEQPSKQSLSREKASPGIDSETIIEKRILEPERIDWATGTHTPATTQTIIKKVSKN